MTVLSYSATINDGGFGPTPGAGATIEIDRMELEFRVAPEVIAFRVTDFTGFDTAGPSVASATGEVYDARLHDFDIIWNFDDAGSTFTAPEKLPSAMLDANLAQGPVVAHIFRSPGHTYNVTCLIVERSSGKWTTVTVPVSTGDPDVNFPITSRVYVDPDSDFTWVPAEATAAQKKSSMADVFTYVTGASKTTVWPIMIVLRAGKTHPITTGPRDGFGDVLFVSSDPLAAAPVLDGTDTSGGGAITSPINFNRGYRTGLTPNVTQYAFVGVNYFGQGDPTVENNLGPTLFSGWEDGGETTRQFRVSAIDCSLGGAEGVFTQLPASWEVGRDLFLGNCVFPDIGDFAVFGYWRAFHAIGNRFAANPSALNGGPKGNDRNEHSAGIRIAKLVRGCVHQNDFFCTSGWDTRATTLQNTPCRINTSSHPGALCNVFANVMEGGNTVITFDESGSLPRSTCNFVCRGNILMSSWSTSQYVVTDKPGTTIENNIFLLPVQQVHTTPEYFLRADKAISQAAQDAGFVWDGAPINIRYNTFAILAEDASFNFQPYPTPVMYESGGSIPAEGIFDIDNVIHAPNILNSVTTYAPMALTTFAQARTSGYQVSWQRLELTLSAEVASGNSATFSYPTGFGQSDFGTKPAQIISGPSAMQGLSGAGNFTVTYGPSDWTLTNNSGTTWGNGSAFTIYLDHRDGGVIPARDTKAAATVDSFKIVRPDTGSAAIAAASGSLLPAYDLLWNLRPGTSHPDATAGTPSKGAVEPV